MGWLTGSIKNAAVAFIYAVDAAHFPIASSQLFHVLAIIRIEIDMAVAIALAGPQEMFAILEELKIAAEINPIGIGFPKQRGRLARLNIDGEGFQAILHTVHAH